MKAMNLENLNYERYSFFAGVNCGENSKIEKMI